MQEGSFVRFIGDYRLHDSRIKEIKSTEDIVQVSIISEGNEIITVKFVGVKSINANRPEGMIIYSISEMVWQSPYRKFVFANWNEEDDASIEIVAKDCIII
jgi:hypothetical protein